MSNWQNYKDDTTLNAKDTSMIEEAVLKAFEITDPSLLIFTTNDTGLGEDYMFFTDIVRNLKPLAVRTLNLPGYIVYISAFDYENKRVVTVDVMNNENYTYNYVFIKNEDFNFFSPDKTQEVEGQEQQMGNPEQQAGQQTQANGQVANSNANANSTVPVV